MIDKNKLKNPEIIYSINFIRLRNGELYFQTGNVMCPILYGVGKMLDEYDDQGFHKKDSTLDMIRVYQAYSQNDNPVDQHMKSLGIYSQLRNRELKEVADVTILIASNPATPEELIRYLADKIRNTERTLHLDSSKMSDLRNVEVMGLV